MTTADKEAQRLDHRVKIGLLVVSLATIAALAFAALQENRFSDWYRIRKQYQVLLRDQATDERGQATARMFDVEIVQNFVPALGVVDRCVTCHAGLEDPRMVDQPHPFRTHPGRYLEIHEPSRFGCTVCHQGQGRSTTVADAHRDAAHWDYPLLDKSFVVSSCTGCHAIEALVEPGGLIEQAGGEPGGLLARGVELARDSGCQGCHMVDGKGGSLGPDLSREGEKTRHDLDFSHMDPHAPRRVAYWLREHFLEPTVVSPGSLMPPVEEPADAEALTAYTLALRSLRGGPVAAAAAATSDKVDAERDGAELYASYCSACHGENGRSGNVAGIDTPTLNSPDVLAVASDDFYRHITADGRSGSQMPAWKEGHGNLSREEIDRIVGHIRAWQPAGAALDDIDSEIGEVHNGRGYYRGLCAGCHGPGGEGGIGSSLRSETFLAIADDRFLARSIVEGRPGTAMPAWRHLSAQAVSDLLAYIRSWQAEPPTLEQVRAAIRDEPQGERAHIGRVVFGRDCASCHGSRGEGGIGPSLAAPDFLGAIDDGYLYRAIVDGRPGTAMPAWKHISASDVAALITFISGLGEAAPIVLPASLPTGDSEVGSVYYEVSCSGCHGPGAIGGSAPQLANPVFLDSVSDAQLYRWIARGRSGSPMIGFLREMQGPVQLGREQIIDIIAYLRDLQTRGGDRVLRTGVGDADFGAELYADTCASCHGPDGEGASGPQLNNPAFLATASDGYLAATIILGRTGTPMQPMVHGKSGLGQIAARNVQDVVAFLRLWDRPQPWRKTRRIPEMSASAVEHGRELFTENCVGCHGPSGRGARDGEGYYAPALNNPQFLAAATDGFLLATIARGRSETPMRPFARGAGGIGALDDGDISDIVSFIRSWQHPAAGSQRRQAK
ncbi:MAG: c-type cytochrome [Candidatus Binatia bacterium]